MTIRFVTGWNGYHSDQVVSGLSNEAALISAGMAVADLDGPDNTPTDAKLSTDSNGNTVLVDSTGAVLIRPVVSYAWADRPDATLNTGVVIRITDIGGTAGSRWISDGTYWKPESGRVVLGSSGAAVSVDVDSTEDLLASVLIPAGCMGPNGIVSVVHTWGYTNSANTKTMRVRVNTSTAVTGDQLLSSAQTTTASIRMWTEWQNRNSTSAQMMGTGQANSILGGGIAGTLVATTANTLVNQYILITGTRVIAETLTLERYMVELIVP